MDARVGLCSVCRHARVTGNRRGSRFYLCGLSVDDPRYPRYPVLPVRRCSGFQLGEGSPPEDSTTGAPPVEDS